jgi:4a-hydroxytetrahydrobiopterin dehydratase
MTGWQTTGEGLYRKFVFADFKAAWTFMSAVALLAEEHRHHPDWRNVYNHVEILLRTHDTNGAITAKDHALAAAIDNIFAKK